MDYEPNLTYPNWQDSEYTSWFDVNPTIGYVARVRFTLNGQWRSEWLCEYYASSETHDTREAAKARIEQEWKDFRRAQWVLAR